MHSKKVNLIVTVRNEIESIDAFMGSILAQENHPDELVVVDAFSTDGTWERLQSYQSRLKKIGIPYVIKQKKGNRSIGRNHAISLASHENICVTDAGCILDSYWYKNLVKPFRTFSLTPGVVCKGWYAPLATIPFQHALATYTCVMPAKLDPQTFLPSSRSIAFSKSIWKAIGGYPEELDTCEDLVFAQRLQSYCADHPQTSQSVFVPDAIVFWPQKSTMWDAFGQFFGYAKGDGQAIGYVWALRWRVVLIYLRYLLGLSVVLLYVRTQSPLLILFMIGAAGAYLVWAYMKNSSAVAGGGWKARAYLPVLQLISDGAVMLGFAYGLVQQLFKRS